MTNQGKTQRRNFIVDSRIQICFVFFLETSRATVFDSFFQGISLAKFSSILCLSPLFLTRVSLLVHSKIRCSSMKISVLIVFIFQIQHLLTIRCYSCSGKSDKKDACFNPAENVGDGQVTEIECLNTKLCWKGVTAGSLKRGCGEKRCAFIPDLNMGSFVTQTCCAHDLCNRTNSMGPTKYFYVLSLIFCLIKFFY